MSNLDPGTKIQHPWSLEIGARDLSFCPFFFKSERSNAIDGVRLLPNTK